MNAQYIRMEDDATLASQLHPVLAQHHIVAEPAYVERVVHLLKDRIETINDLVESSDFLFNAPQTFDESYMRKHWGFGTSDAITALVPLFKALPEFTHESIERCVREFAESKGVKPATLIHPLRLALTGKGVGPGLFELMGVLGKDETILRLESFLHNTSL